MFETTNFNLFYKNKDVRKNDTYLKIVLQIKTSNEN